MPNYGPASPTAASRQYVVLTAHDSTNWTQGITRGVYVGGTGNLVAVMEDDTTCLFSAIPAGTILPIACKRINSTLLTASLLVGLF